MTVQKCPVCEGRGSVKSFQISPKVREKLKPLREPCRTCLGMKKINEGTALCPDCKGIGEKFIEMDGELMYFCQSCKGDGIILRQQTSTDPANTESN